jgi:hypothetical protein
VDSGFLVWRKNFFILIPFFALPVWITAFALRALPFPGWYWPWIVLWFLKPLFDRAVLQVVSVRFFEPRAGLSRIARGLWKNMGRGLPGDLLWRRLSPWRPVMLAVRMLERLSPPAARQRKEALVRGGIDFCLFLSVWGLAMEAALLAGESAFVLAMVELFREDYFLALFENTALLEFFLYTAWCVNYMALEAIYVCMGFGLYINSRVETEGWDIELTFRKLAAGGKKLIRPGAALIAGLVIFAAGPAGALEDAVPRSVESVPETGAEEFPFGLLEEILASEDFGGERESWGIRPKNQGQEEEAEFSFAPWMKRINRAAAWTLRLVLILAAAAVLVLSLRYLRRYSRRYSRRYRTGSVSKKRPDMTVIPAPEEADPAALFARARSFFEDGLPRQAWAHCLAGTLAAWRRRGVAFPRDATEYDCLALVQRAAAGGEGTAGRAVPGDPVTAGVTAGAASGPEDFARLVGVWAAFAYGGRTPPAEDFERFCDYGRSLIAGGQDEGASGG